MIRYKYQTLVQSIGRLETYIYLMLKSISTSEFNEISINELYLVVQIFFSLVQRYAKTPLHTAKEAIVTVLNNLRSLGLCSDMSFSCWL